MAKTIEAKVYENEMGMLIVENGKEKGIAYFRGSDNTYKMSTEETSVSEFEMACAFVTCMINNFTKTDEQEVAEMIAKKLEEWL